MKNILRMGHPTLRKKSEPICISDIGSLKIKNLITDLSDTLEASGGIGLAAPQIGELTRIVIVKIPEGSSSYGELESFPLTVFINPIIKPVGQKRNQQKRPGGKPRDLPPGVRRQWVVHNPPPPALKRVY